MRTGLIAAMEEIENIDPVAVEETPEAITAVAVADESTEIQADSDEIGTTVSQVEDAVQAGEELEDIADVAADAVASGEGFDEKTAEVASIAIESIRNRLGVYEETRLVPVRESFGNTNTKLMSTKLILEGVSDFIKKIWTAIKQASLRAWEMIKSFFAKIFNSATLLAKNIASLKARANALPSGSAPKEKKIKTGVAKQISVKGKADLASYETILKNSTALVGVATEVSKMSRTIVAAAETLASGGEINQAKVSTFLNAKKGSVSTIEKTVSSAFSGAEAAFSDSELNAVMKTPKQSKGSKATVRCFGPFVGSVALTMSADGDNFSLSFGAVPGKTATEVDALTLAEVKSVLASAGSLANSLQEFKKTQSEMDGITKAVNKVADTVLSNAAKILDKTGSSNETREGLADLKATVSDSIAMLNNFGNRAPTFMFNMAKAGADYASVSLRNLGEK